MKISELSRNLRIQRRLMQAAILLGGIVPVWAGLAGVIMGTSMVMGPERFIVPLDSHYRYLSGLLLGIGIAFWTCVPRIEKRGDRFRALAAVVFIGGIGRLTSLHTLGWPDTPMTFGLIMELIVTPLLAIWQYKWVEQARG